MKRLTLMLWVVMFGAAAGEYPVPQDSVYQLKAGLTTQGATAAALNLYQGHPVVISMFYGNCPAACPMLITGIQAYEAHLPPASRDRLRVLMISFDQARDTPEQLSGLARLHRADTARWTFASAGESDARKIAALLGISYRRQADGEFDHSLRITLLDDQGRVLAKTSKIVGDDAFQASLRLATSGESR